MPLSTTRLQRQVTAPRDELAVAEYSPASSSSAPPARGCGTRRRSDGSSTGLQRQFYNSVYSNSSSQAFTRYREVRVIFLSTKARRAPGSRPSRQPNAHTCAALQKVACVTGATPHARPAAPHSPSCCRGLPSLSQTTRGSGQPTTWQVRRTGNVCCTRRSRRRMVNCGGKSPSGSVASLRVEGGVRLFLCGGSFHFVFRLFFCVKIVWFHMFIINRGQTEVVFTSHSALYT